MYLLNSAERNSGLRCVVGAGVSLRGSARCCLADVPCAGRTSCQEVSIDSTYVINADRFVVADVELSKVV